MAGRKTIMVDVDAWNKVEKLKHKLYLRSSSDAIETAIDSTVSTIYYAGINAEKSPNGNEIYYRVESLGRTEDEAVRNMLIYEQGDIFGDIRAEDIPSVYDTDVNKEGWFVVECTKKMYHKLVWIADPSSEDEELLPNGYSKYYCQISKKDDGSFIADIDADDGDEFGGVAYYVQYKPLGNNVGRIFRCGVSCACMSAITDYKIAICSPKLYAEYLKYYCTPEGLLCTIQNNKTGEPYADIISKGKYYAVVNISSNPPSILSIGNSANDVLFRDFETHREYVTKFWFVWDEVYESGERVGKCDGNDIILVECTKELYCKVLLSAWYDDHDEEPVECEIKGEVGNRLAC